jgi:hypothetical protein
MMEAAAFGYAPLEMIWPADGKYWTVGDIIGKPPEWFEFNSEAVPVFKTGAAVFQAAFFPRSLRKHGALPSSQRRRFPPAVFLPAACVTGEKRWSKPLSEPGAATFCSVIFNFLRAVQD